MSNVIFAPRAVKDLEKLDRPVRRRILEKLQSNAADPLRTATRLTDPRIGTYRYRIGDYRVIFDLEGDTVVVLRVGHRREIYA